MCSREKNQKITDNSSVKLIYTTVDGHGCRQCITHKFNSQLNTIIKCTGHHHPPLAHHTIMATLCKLQGQHSLDLRLNEYLDRLIYTSQRLWRGPSLRFLLQLFNPQGIPFNLLVQLVRACLLSFSPMIFSSPYIKNIHIWRYIIYIYA